MGKRLGFEVTPQMEADFRSELAGRNPTLQAWGEGLLQAVKTYNLLSEQIRRCGDAALKLPALRQASDLVDRIDDLQRSIAETVGKSPFQIPGIDVAKIKLQSAIRQCEVEAQAPARPFVLPGLPQPRAL